MRENLLLFTGVLLSLGCAVSGSLFLRAGWREDYRQAFLRKGLAGLYFVLLGAANAFLCPDISFRIYVLAGLCFGLVGDELLAMRFIKPERHDYFFSRGASAFAFGHLLYIAALFHHGSSLPLALPVFVLGFGASMLYFRVKKVQAGKLQLPSGASAWGCCSLPPEESALPSATICSAPTASARATAAPLTGRYISVTTRPSCSLPGACAFCE